MNLFASPNEVDITSDELIGKFVILEPLEHTSIQTAEFGNREAVVARVFEMEGQDVKESGTTLIFWKAVRNQLLSVSPAAPVVAGYVEQADGKNWQYYTLAQRTPEGFDAERVSGQLQSLGVGA